ncbi:MAG: biotin carboxylase N-terminal domain-containing protein [Bacteroidota bacterium]
MTNSAAPAFPTSLLIANRGEIASRIIRTCRRLGIRTIAIYSDADADLPFVEEADEAMALGGLSPAESYLDQGKIIAAIEQSGAEAVHPGYGFLAENAGFAAQIEALDGVQFVGPGSAIIQQMGDKAEARQLMEQHGIPLVPGYQGADQSEETLTAKATEIGFPLLLKAAAGGGGKGMRIVNSPDELSAGMEGAKREAKSAFGNDTLIVERYISSGRHIEVQLAGDQHGNLIHLLERECSLQRRFQKVMEESPSPVLDEDLREEVTQLAVRVGKALDYDNLGTVEFLFDEASKAFYFLEVNTRLQVEHGVTEAITGLDLVQMQIEIAAGFPLSLAQEEVKSEGYAIQFRLYAEQPEADFRPAAGHLLHLTWPKLAALRIDSSVRSGSDISPFYDPMVAKLIVHSPTRARSLQLMSYALDQTICLGLPTNLTFLRSLLRQQAVQQGQYDTRYLGRKLSELVAETRDPKGLAYALIAATAWQWAGREEKRSLLRHLPSGWRNNPYQDQVASFEQGEIRMQVQYRFESSKLLVTLADQTYVVEVKEQTGSSLQLFIDNRLYPFAVASDGAEIWIHQAALGTYSFQLPPRFPLPTSLQEAGGYQASMPATIVKVLVEAGQAVEAGEGVLVLSSMKMETTISAHEAGTVKSILITEGQHVAAGELLLEMEE